MSVFSTILNFFGTKSDRDMKELAPSVNEVLSHTQTFSNFSHDQLREKTLDFKLEKTLEKAIEELIFSIKNKFFVDLDNLKFKNN